MTENATEGLPKWTFEAKFLPMQKVSFWKGKERHVGQIADCVGIHTILSTPDGRLIATEKPDVKTIRYCVAYEGDIEWFPEHMLEGV